MEKLVETVMRHERQSDLLDRAVLTVGIVSLCLALAGTMLSGHTKLVAVQAPTITAV